MFTDELYIDTKDAHTVVDRHPFVSMIRKNKEAGNLYINFNKICIKSIEGVYDINNIDKYLIRNINDDINLINSKSLEELKVRCKEYPLEHIYMFYLGLLFGGNMLSRMLPEHSEFLKFEEPKERIRVVKEYLDTNVKDRTLYIERVNYSYKLIKNIFDDFYNYIINSESNNNN